jgi:hypothetical protein
MAVIISLVLLAAGLYILLADHASSDLEKAATGWIGIIIGYWLK